MKKIKNIALATLLSLSSASPLLASGHEHSGENLLDLLDIADAIAQFSQQGDAAVVEAPSEVKANPLDVKVPDAGETSHPSSQSLIDKEELASKKRAADLKRREIRKALLAGYVNKSKELIGGIDEMLNLEAKRMKPVEVAAVLKEGDTFYEHERQRLISARVFGATEPEIAQRGKLHFRLGEKRGMLKKKVKSDSSLSRNVAEAMKAQNAIIQSAQQQEIKPVKLDSIRSQAATEKLRADGAKVAAATHEKYMQRKEQTGKLNALVAKTDLAQQQKKPWDSTISTSTRKRKLEYVVEEVMQQEAAKRARVDAAVQTLDGNPGYTWEPVWTEGLTKESSKKFLVAYDKRMAAEKAGAEPEIVRRKFKLGSAQTAAKKK